MDQGDASVSKKTSKPPEPGSTNRKHVHYFATMFFVVLFLIATPLIIVRTDFYPRYSNYFYDPVIDFKASLKNEHPDVLFYGDSSALHNVVPSIIAKRTGLTVYNLGLTASIVGGAPDLMLDRYLAHNGMPHVIVLYISPPTKVNGYDLDRGHFYEAALVVERYASIKDAIALYVANPRRAFAVAAVVFRNLLTPPQLTQKNFKDVSTALAAQSGWVPTPDLFRGGVGFLPAQDGAPRQTLVADGKYINDFRRKYEALGAQVLVYISPTNACSDLTVDEVTKAYQGLSDNKPYAFPCDSYRGEFHLVQQAAENNSELVSDFLIRKLNINRSARQ